MLDTAATDLGAEIETATEVMLSLFEALPILAMGGTVPLIGRAMLLPVFEMNESVG